MKTFNCALRALTALFLVFAALTALADNELPVQTFTASNSDVTVTVRFVQPGEADYFVAAGNCNQIEVIVEKATSSVITFDGMGAFVPVDLVNLTCNQESLLDFLPTNNMFKAAISMAGIGNNTLSRGEDLAQRVEATKLRMGALIATSRVQGYTFVARHNRFVAFNFRYHTNEGSRALKIPLELAPELAATPSAP